MTAVELAKLPFEIQLILTAGYLAYRLASAGLDRAHRTTDVVFQVFAYGAVAYLGYALSAPRFGFAPAMAAAVLVALAGAGLWRAGAWLAWELIRAAEDKTAGDPEGYLGGVTYLGIDVARRRDLWVAAVLERVGGVLWAREIAVRQNISFSEQRQIVRELAERYRPVRIAVDQTGMGEAVVEQLQDDHNRIRVEGVLMTGPAASMSPPRFARPWRTAALRFHPRTISAAISTPSTPRPAPPATPA